MKIVLISQEKVFTFTVSATKEMNLKELVLKEIN